MGKDPTVQHAWVNDTWMSRFDLNGKVGYGGGGRCEGQEGTMTWRAME